MKSKKKLEDFQDTKKDAKKLNQIKGGSGGLSSGAKIPTGDPDE